MRYRSFGTTELSVSEIGFGAWAIGGDAMIGTTAIGWGDADDKISRAAIFKALDRGINFFDTADIYGLGHSEKLLGETVGRQKEVIIATKVGNVAREEQFTTDYSKQYIITACEASLLRLKRDHIDYYQLHTARIKNLEEGECLEAMELLTRQGKIRYWGLSLNTFDPAPEAEYLMESKLGHGFQLVLNILNQRALGLVKKAGDMGYGLIARMPLQFGLLTGKFDKEVSFSASDHRKKRLTPGIIELSANALAPAWKLCTKYNCSKTELALSYVLAYPAISTVIPGIRTVKQAEENTITPIQLEEKDLLRIEELGITDLDKVMKEIQALG